MNDADKPKNQLIEELEQLRLRIKDLQAEQNDKRHREERCERVVDLTQEAIIFFDIDTRQIIHVNKTAEKMYGYSREEFLKLKQNDITAEPDASDKSIKELVSKQYSHIPVRSHRRKDGTVFQVEISGHFIPLHNVQTVACGIIREIDT